MAAYWKAKHLLFIHVPKAAGVSITEKLKSYGAVTMHAHLTAMELKETFPDRYNGTYKFCVVRNTWQRLVSGFYHLLNVNRQSFGRRKRAKRQRFYLRYSVLGFDRWLREVGLETPSQLDYISDQDGVLVTDKICRFEHVQDDLHEIGEKFDFDFNIGWHNSTEHPTYRESFSDETRDMVFERYREEIEMFGYKY